MSRRDTQNSKQDARLGLTLTAICAATALLAGCDDPTADPGDEPDESMADAEESSAGDQGPAPADGPGDFSDADLPGQRIANAMPFGTMCQADFQNGWQATLSYAWNRCGGFNSVFNQVATQYFYYNLVGAKPYIESTWDAWAADSVQLLYFSTHGGAWDGTAAYAMWNQDEVAYSSAMRFDTLSMFSGYACQTLQMDSQLITRWYPAMAGGLSVVTGSHGYLHDSWYTDDTGADYAEDLTHQWNVKDAWIDGLWDTYTTQDVAVLAAGSTADDCYTRLAWMSPYDYFQFSRLHDWQIGYMCWSYVTE